MFPQHQAARFAFIIRYLAAGSRLVRYCGFTLGGPVREPQPHLAPGCALSHRAAIGPQNGVHLALVPSVRDKRKPLVRRDSFPFVLEHVQDPDPARTFFWSESKGA